MTNKTAATFRDEIDIFSFFIDIKNNICRFKAVLGFEDVFNKHKGKQFKQFNCVFHPSLIDTYRDTEKNVIFSYAVQF